MLRRFLTSLLVSLSLVAPALSQLVATPPRDCAAPCPPNATCTAVTRCRPGPALVQRMSSRVRAELDGHVIRYEVAETYVNRGGIVGEADYMLPLPRGAAFEDLALSINGEMVTGETMNSDRARAVYEEIVRKLRDPALVEWMGLGLLRMHIFPILSDVNTAPVEQLALQGRGTVTFVRPDESVERTVGIVAERLMRPVATDVRLHADGVRFYGTQPEGAIDLFAGQDLVVLARDAGARENATLTVEGRSPDGPMRWRNRVSLPARSGENAFVARLWAVQRAGYLSAERHRGGDSTEIDAELRLLGERFAIPMELTSYLVKEPGMQVVGSISPGSRPALGPSRATAPNSLFQGVVSGSADRFEAAKVASEQRELKNLAELDKSTRRDGKDGLRMAGSLTFELKDSVWTDMRAADGLRVIRVRAYSAAYFALLQRIPELGPLFAVDERVRVNGRRIAIEVGASGDAQFDAATLDALVRDC